MIGDTYMRHDISFQEELLNKKWDVVHDQYHTEDYEYKITNNPYAYQLTASRTPIDMVMLD